MTWFQKRQPEPSQSKPVTPDKPLNYPSGVAVETASGVYFIKGKTKFRAFSTRVADSWFFDTLQGSDITISNFKSGPPLGFRNGTLIKNFSDGKVYLISDNKKRLIEDPDVFDRYGFNRDYIVEVSQQETNLHEEGEVLR